MTMVFVMGTMEVRPDDVARLKAPIVRQTTAARAQPGCEHYSLAQDIVDPVVIQVAERWVDQPAMAAHLVGDHMVQFNIDLRTAKLLRARVDSFHPGGEARKLIDQNAASARFVKENRAMVIVMGTARLAAGEIDRLADAMRAQVEATRAEDGCEHYSFARDVADPDLLHIAERWRDNAAIAAHFATPHMAAFNAVLAGAKVLSLSVKAYDEDGVRTLMGS